MTQQGQGKSNSSEINLALDLTNEAVTLHVRHGDGSWKPVGTAVLEDPNFDDQIDALRVEALVRAKTGECVLLWLPAEQVIARELELAPGSEDAARTEALSRIAAETDFDAAELTVAMTAADDGKKTIVMAALLQTLDEAQSYADRWGFPKTIVSTRGAERHFGANGPNFARPPTIAHQASQAVRRLAVAAVVAIAATGAIYGGYRALEPLLDEPVDIRSSGPAISSFAVVLDPVYSTVTPLRSVSFGTADALAIQRVYIPDDERISAFGFGIYAGGYPDFDPPELTAPNDGRRMLVGSAPVLPNRDRPGRLAAVTSPAALPDTGPVRTAIDLIRLDAQLTADPPEVQPGPDNDQSDDSGEQDLAALTPQQSDTVPDLAAESAIGSARPPKTGVTDGAPGSTDPGADPTADTPTGGDASLSEADDPDAPTELAPLEMADAPLPRPDVPPEVSKQEEGPTDSAETPVADSEKPQDATADNASIASTSAPAPIPRSEEALEDSAADQDTPTQFAALSAPEPSKRPKVFSREVVRPRATKGAVAAVAIPRTVRSAARQVGLELDKTSLIGVIDARSGRQALVRMPGGTYRKVSRGDILDGWRVNSISREAMRLTKRGQNRTLLLVSR